MTCRWRSVLSGEILAIAAILAIAPEARAVGVVVEVQAGPHARQDCPVVFPLPESLAPSRAFWLERLDDHQPVDVQLVPGEPPSVAWIVRDPIPAGGSRRFRLEAASVPARAEAVALDDGRSLRLEVGGHPVLEYRHAVVESPSGLPAYYRRSGQVHPIRTPSGLVVTDDFPPDHAHQHGLFFAWVNTTFEGKAVDFWNQKDRTGRVEHAETLGKISGPVFGQFRVRLRHDALIAPDDPKPVLDETWTVRAYNLADRFLVDFESSQKSAGSSPLTINAHPYGGLGLRGNRGWLDPEVKGNDPPDPSRSGRSDFLTSEGKARGDGNHTRPRWVDLSGQVADRVAGIAILDHPENFRFPQPVRLHPNKPYFCFAPMVLGGFEIAPGHPYVSRYRLVIHDGPPDREALERAWRDYAEPPSVRLVPEGR